MIGYAKCLNPNCVILKSKRPRPNGGYIRVDHWVEAHGGYNTTCYYS